MLNRLFLSTPKRQAFTYVIVVAVIYFTLSRPVEFSRSIVLKGDYAYLASEADGLRVLDISQPDHPKLVKHIPVRRNAYALYLQEDYLYMAAGTEGLHVYSIQQPANPVLISSINTPGIAYDVEVSDRYVYLADGKVGVRIFEVAKDDSFRISPIATFPTRSATLNLHYDDGKLYISQSNQNVTILNVNNPARPNEIGSYDAQAEVNDIFVENRIGYLAAGQRGLVVIDTSNPSEINEISVYKTAGEASAIWLHGEYVYLASGNAGVRVLDTYDLTQIREVGFQDTPGQASDLVLREGIAYVADGFSGLQTLSVQVLIPLDQVASSHQRINLEKVTISSNYAYMTAGENGLRVMDVVNPMDPVEINTYQSSGYLAGVTIEGDLAYLASKNAGLELVDISDPRGRLQKVSQVVIGEDSYAVALLGDYAYLADGLAGLKVIDKTVPIEPVEVGRVDTPGNAMDVVVLNQFAYIADGQAGLRIIDITDSVTPLEIGHYDSPGDAQAVAVATSTVPVSAEAPGEFRTYAYIADGSRGLRVVDVTNPRIPALVGVNESLSFVQDVIVIGTNVYAAGREQGLIIFDVADPSDPIVLSAYDTPGRATGVDVNSLYAYVADFERGLRVIEVSSTVLPVEVGFYDSPATAKDVSLVDPYAYVADGQEGMWSVSISDLETMRGTGFYPTPGEALRVSTFNGYAFISDGVAGVQIVDISAPPELVKVAEIDTPGSARDVYVDGSIAYIVDGLAGLQIYDLSDLAQINLLGELKTPGVAQGVMVQEEYAYVTTGPAGLQVIKISIPNLPSRVGVVSGITDARRVFVIGDYAYIAGGVAGMQVVDVSHPLTPELVATFPTPTAVEDIYVIGNYAFLAIGEGGVQVVDISDTRKPVLVGQETLAGPALGLDVITRGPTDNQPLKFEIFAAADQAALIVLEGSKTLSSADLGVYETPGSATPAQIRNYLVARVTRNPEGRSEKAARTLVQIFFDWFVIGLGGLILWLTFFAQFTLPVSGLYERITSIDRLIAFLRGRHGPALHVREGKVVGGSKEQGRRGPGVVLVDLSSAVVLARAGISPASASLLSPFIRVVQRIRRFFTKRGKKEAAPSGHQPPIRVTGAGLVFTGPHPGGQQRFDERVQDVADLRPQIRGVQNVQAYTRDGIEIESNVIAVFTLGQPPEVVRVTYQGDRLPENLRVIYTGEKVLTAPDGTPIRRITVVKELLDELEQDDKEEIHRFVSGHHTGVVLGKATISIPENDLYPFQYDSRRVFAALASEAHDVKRNESSDWTELPARVAADVFRNMLAQNAYDYLYQPLDPDKYEPLDPDKYELQNLKGRFSKAVRYLGVLCYQYVEDAEDEVITVGQEWDVDELIFYPIQELRQPKILRARGIKVINATFGELKPVNPAVYEQRLESWRSGWEREELTRSARFHLRAMRVRNQARIQGQRELALILARILQTSSKSREVVALRLFQALESAATHPKTRQLLPETTLSLLNTIGTWLKE